MHMKENVKIFLVALIIGMTVAFFLSFKFQDEVVFAINPKVTIFYVGTYNDIEVANKKSESYDNSLIYEDNGVYKIVIGVYHDDSALLLMNSYFRDLGISFYQEEIKVDTTFLKEISNYELLIKESENSYYDNINTYILELFKEYLGKNN